MHELELSFSSLLGSAAGGGAVVFLAKLYLQRAFKDLDGVVLAMQRVQKDLATIAVRLEKFEKYDDMIRDHEKKIAVLEKVGCLNDKGCPIQPIPHGARGRH